MYIKSTAGGAGDKLLLLLIIGPNIYAEMLNGNFFIFLFLIVFGFTNRTDNGHVGSKY